MKVVKKFVINRNNLAYYYTEKIDDISGYQYAVYSENNITAFTPDAFYMTFGTDEKMPLIKFLKKAETDLVMAGVYDNGAPIVLKKFDEVNQKISGKNFINPSLWGYKETFVTSINYYNQILATREKDFELDYEKEAETLKGLLSNTNEEHIYTRTNKQDIA